MESTARVITKIEANPMLAKNLKGKEYLRVAAYARVSTDSEDQLESYKAQVAYYTDAISKNPKWRFVEIYADEGITGTIDKKRPNFLRMIRDCEKGKIDLILTKSVARFARNTVDSLRYVRKLKAKGIGVYFEEQALDSLKAENEMAIGLYSVMAQAESENISANVRWGIQQRMKSGTFKFRYDILGYEKGEDGQPKIKEDEAKIVREIFNLYLSGESFLGIKGYLEKNGFATKKGNSGWSTNLIRKMLTNEKYCGDFLMQKTFVDNCISKKTRVNRGELPKYLISNNHPAIIERSQFNLVQKEIARRSSIKKKSELAITQKGKYSKYLLSELLVCGDCGSPYRRRIRIRNGNKKIYWRCVNRLENGNKYCKDSITVDECLLKDTIKRALKKIVESDKDVYEMVLSNLTYSITGQDTALEIFSLENQIKESKDMIDTATKQLATTSGDGHNLFELIKDTNTKIIILREQLELKKASLQNSETVEVEIERIKELLNTESGESYDEYNEKFVRSVVDYIRVLPYKALEITLKGGFKIEENFYEK